jgi:threonine 3-dehydrogenase
LKIDPVITHRFPFQEFQRGFDAMLTRASGKVILTWNEG